MIAADTGTASCVLPGCPSPVQQWGQACGQCATELGDFLRPTAGPGLSREDISARDAGVRKAYAMHEQIRRTGYPATDSGLHVTTAPTSGRTGDRYNAANQELVASYQARANIPQQNTLTIHAREADQ